MQVSGQDRLLITGLGPVGLAAAMLGARAGRQTDHRHRPLGRSGWRWPATWAWSTPPSRPTTARSARSWSGPAAGAARSSIDCSGAAAARLLALQGTRDWGRCAYVGEGGTVSFEVSKELIHKQITLFGSWVTSLRHMEELVERLDRWGLHPDRTCTQGWPFPRPARPMSWRPEARRGRSASCFEDWNRDDFILQGRRIRPMSDPWDFAPGRMPGRNADSVSASQPISWPGRCLVFGLCGHVATRALAAPPQDSDRPAIAQGPFQPSVESLKQYQVPGLVPRREVRHLGPLGAAGRADVRRLVRPADVRPGTRQYKDHLEHYGHPSKLGYKDIIPLWKAEKWDPDRLMALYKKAGASYFVSMGVASRQLRPLELDSPPLERGARWARTATSSATGRRPRRSWAWSSASPSTWAPASPGSRTATGRTRPGRSPAFPTTAPIRSTRTSITGRPTADDDRLVQQGPALAREWFRRIKDLVDQYHPDLLYTDGGVPFGNEPA